jgi:phosphatidylglycerol:prolipoprotein diacylglycerol transferase
VLPFVNVKPFEIGPLEIHLFGILVATGVVLGAALAARYAEKHAVEVDWLRWLGFRLVVGGFIISHVLDVLLYQPGEIAKDPLVLIKIWQSISSYGGFVGGFLTFMWYTQARYKPPVSRLELADNVMIGLSIGFWFGRMGCSVAHDHPGVPTDFPLAPVWPAGKWKGYGAYDLDPSVAVQAHDLGLYEALFLMPIIVAGVLLLARWKGRKPGLLVAYAAVVYAIPRFFLEFLRIESTDPRYAGLTPAQWFSIMTLVAGIYLFTRIGKQQTTAELAAARFEAGAVPPPSGDKDESEPAAKSTKSGPRKGAQSAKKKSGGKSKKKR